MSTKGEFTKEDQKELQRLFENAKSGLDEDIEALVRFEKEKKIEPDEEEAYLSMKIEPETEQEKRLEMKGRPADKRRSAEAIDIDAIAKAYGVDLKEAQDEGELVKGDLQNYLNSRFVARPSPYETRDEYEQRNINAFESLGLNWFNKGDRERVFKSMEAANLLDAREGLAEEATSGVGGFLRSLVFPRTTERAVKDILEGEDSEGYGKDIALDVAENALQSIASPVTGGFAITGKGLRAARAAKAAREAQKAASTARKAVGAMTAAERAQRAGKSAGTLAGIGGDAAAVPFLMELADAAAYDEEESPRGEFSPEDVLVGAAVNAITPVMLQRYGRRGARMAGEEGTKAEKALEDLQEVTGAGRLRDYLTPYVTNKAGRSESVRALPLMSDIVEKQKEESERREKKERTLREKEAKWSRGLSIPMPGDRDYEDYRKFKERVTKRMMLRDYVE